MDQARVDPRGDQAPSKRQWRRRATEERADLVIDSARHCDDLAQFLTTGRASGEIRPGWVVGYLAMGGEVDLSALFVQLDLGPFAVTRTPDHGNDLTVHPLDSPRELHRYGFEQPVATAPVVADAEIAVVLVPGLAFDRSGGRLGRGKGYYDRFLARLLGHAGSGQMAFVGITSGYIVDDVPTEAHDVVMTHLATGSGVTRPD